MTKQARPTTQAHFTDRRSLTLALAVTIAWFAIELAAGFYTNSLALLADAGHMLTDLAALSLSLFALKVAALPATNEKTYGYLRAEILAALANGVFLVLIGLVIAFKAYQRLHEPPEIKSSLMLAVAVIGLAANLISARLLSHSDSENLNVRGAFLHVTADILGSVGAIVAGILMSIWHWYLADPIVSMLVAALIVFSSWRLLRDSVDVLLEGTPRHLNAADIIADLGAVPGVRSLHDFHIWSITSGMPAMSCHVVVRRNADPAAILMEMRHRMRVRHGVEHTTIQTEMEEEIVTEIQ
jgi:cobalt-zinc-cadmium efflux system protein